MRRLRLLIFAAVACSCSTGIAPCSAGGGDVVIQQHCVSCHSAALTGLSRMGAPLGVNFDGVGDVQRFADRIRQRAIIDRTMPPGAPLEDCAATPLGDYLTQVSMMPGQPSCS